MRYIQHPRTLQAILALVSGVLMVRLFVFISRYAADILYWDQWAFYTPLFGGQGLWQLFAWQHGPVREGLGLIVTSGLARLTGWDSQADAFAVGALLCLAMLSALVLTHRLFGSLDFFDLIIPLLFLSLFQYEAIVVVPNLSYGAFPVLLIMLYALSLGDRESWRRRLLLLILNFFLMYTGFGMFMGPLTVGMFAVELLQDLRRHHPITLAAMSLALALVTNLSFLISYRFAPAIPNFGFSVSYLLQYPLFVGLMLAAFWGWHTMVLGQFVPLIAGAILLLATIAILVHHGQRLARQGLYSNRLSLVIVILLAFSLLFCLSTAIGRTPLGLGQAQVSRYLTLMIPGYFACLLHLRSLHPSRPRQMALAIFLVISMAGSLPFGIVEAQAQRAHDNKLSWKRCYLQLEDIEACNQLTGEQIFPGVDGMRAKLDYLKVHQLNLYLDAEP